MTTTKQLLFLVGFLAAVIGCGGGRSADTTEGPLRVVATTSIVGDLARSIGGDVIELETLMGAGVDPHLYKPSAGDVRAMASAQVIVYSGLHLEGKMTEVLAEIGTRGVETVEVAACVPAESLLAVGGYDNLHDPHVWFDVGLWQHAAACLRDALIRIDPENAVGYQERGDAVIAEFADLDVWVREQVATLPENRRVLVTAHGGDGPLRGLLPHRPAGHGRSCRIHCDHRHLPVLPVGPHRYVLALHLLPSVRRPDLTDRPDSGTINSQSYQGTEITGDQDRR